MKLVTVITDSTGNPWWVAKEVCEILGIDNVGNVLARLDDDEVLSIRLTDLQKRKGRGGDNGYRAIVNEAGLYQLILRSDKPQAKEFRRWITHEVLPQIRKTGGYIPVTPGATDAEIMARALRIADRTIKEAQKQIEEMKPLECCDGQS